METPVKYLALIAFSSIISTTTFADEKTTTVSCPNFAVCHDKARAVCGAYAVLKQTEGHHQSPFLHAVPNTMVIRCQASANSTGK